MRIMVIGGAGYVGSVLIDHLFNEDAGHYIRVIDRLYFGDQGLDAFKDKIELINMDIRRLDKKYFKDIDVVINLSGLSNDPTANYNPEANKAMNTDATIRAATLAKEMGVKRFVFASTCSVYDFGDSGCIDKLMTEKDEVDPKSYYASSKRAAELGLEKLADENFTVVCLRKGTVFGWSPRMRYDLIVQTMLKTAITTGKINLHNSGAIWRPLVHIDDASRAYIEATRQPMPEPFNIINVVGDNYRVSEVGIQVYKVLKDLKVPVELNPETVIMAARNYRADNSKMKHLLKFSPQVSLYEGIAHLYQKIYWSGQTDFSNPVYYNIAWLKLLEKTEEILRHNNYEVF